MSKLKQGYDKPLAQTEQQHFTNIYTVDVCECLKTRNICKAQIEQRKTRYKHKYLHAQKTCNPIYRKGKPNGSHETITGSNPALCFVSTISLALYCNLLQHVVGSLVWHATASTAISIFATFYYFIANTQGATAVLDVTTATLAWPTTTSLSSSSVLHTSLTTPAATDLSFFPNPPGYSDSSDSDSYSDSDSDNGSGSNNTTTIIDNINFNLFLHTKYKLNSTEISILNAVSSLPGDKMFDYGFDNNSDSSNSNTNTTNNNNVITVSYNNGVGFNETFDEIPNENASEYIFDRTDVRIIFITLYTMVFCCCFFGNLLVILVVTLSRRLRSITNFFLANLALADFCVGFFCVMQNLSIYLIDSWVFGEFLCRMYQFVHSLSYTASIFILVVICMERYFAIVHPITCKQILTAARLRMVILTVWITSAVYSTPKFVFSKTIKNIHTESGREEEICVLDRKMFNSKLLDMINFGLLYVVPLLVMTVLYSKIAVALWRSSRGLQHHLAQQENGMGMHNSMYHHHQHRPCHNQNHNIQQQQQKPKLQLQPQPQLQPQLQSQPQPQQHHHNHSLHNQHPQLSQQQHQQQQQPLPPLTAPLGTSISVNSSAVSGSTLSRKHSCKYDSKRGVNISESQVCLDDDRPVVSTCRKTSFFKHSHNHLSHQQQTSPQAASTNHQRSHHGLHGSQRVTHISHSSNNVLRARRGVVRMLIIFVLTFALCNLPYHARKMWQYWSRSYRGDSNFNALLTPLTFLVTYFNSAINPLLYAFLSRNFRKGMKELLMCSWRKSKTKSSTNSSMHHKRIALQTNSLPTTITHIGNEQI